MAYLKNPPASYRQPPVDLLGGLDSIQQAVTNGVYKNEYDFEVAVQNLVYSTHDAHISLYAGVLGVFSFGAPVSIVSVSSDGIALPKVFILGKHKHLHRRSPRLTTPDDLLETGDPSNKAQWTPSAILSINGVQVEDFLKNFAASNSPGTLEANADWNQLMSNPANDVQGLLSAFEGSSPFWPGNEITIAFENGTAPLTLTWLATYSIPEDTPKITSGSDLYKIFVLGDSTDVDYNSAPSAFPTATAAATSSGLSFPDSTSTATPVDDTSAAAASSSTAVATAAPAQATSWEYFPYPPDPVTVQPNLGDGGIITGYFLNDGVTAVLSIPSFDVSDEAIISFSTTIGDFIQKSKDAQKERFIIDLQRNAGGGNLLAVDTFKQVCQNLESHSSLADPSLLSFSLPLIHSVAVDCALTMPPTCWVAQSPPTSTTRTPLYEKSLWGAHGPRVLSSTPIPRETSHPGRNSMVLTLTMEISSQQLNAIICRAFCLMKLPAAWWSMASQTVLSHHRSRMMQKTSFWLVHSGASSSKSANVAM